MEKYKYIYLTMLLFFVMVSLLALPMFTHGGVMNPTNPMFYELYDESERNQKEADGKSHTEPTPKTNGTCFIKTTWQQ